MKNNKHKEQGTFELLSDMYNEAKQKQIMQTDIIYISGKITGAPNLNKHKFDAAEKHLSNYSIAVLNPHKLPHNHNKSWASYMRVCIKALCNCHKVVVLDDWKNSKGAIREVLIARWLNIPIIEIETMSELKISLLLKIKLLLKLI